MIRLKRVLGAGALLLASVAAQAVDTTYTFDSITAIQHSVGGTSLTGVLASDTVPSSITAFQADTALSNRCIKYYDLMLENQGIYTLGVTIRTTTAEQVPGGVPVTTHIFYGCSIELKP